MENTNFKWENPLFQWPFSIYSYVTLPEGKHIETVILERTKICGPSHGTCVTLERFTLLVVHSTPLWSACSDAPSSAHGNSWL